MNRIDSSIARTGRNLDNLGGRGAENLNRVGSGADAAASRVDAATRNIAGAVERANAALVAGKKSSSDYFEELARSRGADLLKLAPLIAQLRETEAAQARAKAATDATTAAQVAAAEAARTQATALREAAQAQNVRENFLAGLREQIQLFGKSADEVARYRAAQAGLAGAAEPLILELRQLRDAQEAANASQQQAAQRRASGDAMLANLREQIALQGKTVEEVLRYRAALAGTSADAEPLIQQLQRVKAGQEAATEAARALAAARQQAAQTQATGEAFLANLREQAALYGKSAEEVLRYRAAQLGLAGVAAPLLAQLQSVKLAQDAVTAAARSSAEAQRQAAQAQAGKDNFVASLQQQAAAIGKTRVELLELQAAQMGVTAQSAPFIQRLREAEQGLNNAGMSARANAAALRGVPAQFTDIIVSLQGGQAPLTVLLQQGGQLKDMFGGAGNAVKALGGYVIGLINPYTLAAAAAVALGVAYYQGQAEAKAFAMSIAMTGNVAGVTAGQMGGMAKAASEAAGTQGKNAEVLAQLVGTGKVGADQLVAASVAAVRSQKFLGIEVENTVKAYADLGADPLKATLKLSEQYGYLTLSTYQQIKALENQGRTLDAAKVAQAAYGDAMLKKSKDVEASLGTLSRAWNSVVSGAKSAWDAMLDVGRQDSLDEKLEKAEERVKKAKLAFFSFAGSNAQKQAELDSAERDRDSLLNQRKVAALKAEQEGADQRRNRAAIEFSEQAEKYLTRREKMLLEIDKITALANKGRPIAGYDEESIKAAQDYEKKFQASIAGIRGQYADVNNAGIASQIGAVQRLGEVQEEVAKRARINLDMQQQSGGLQTLDKRIAYAEAVAKMDEQAIQREKTRAQQRLAITATETVSADQQGAQQEKLAALRGQVAKADQEILTRRAELSKEVFGLEIADSRAALDALDKLSEARFAEVQSLESQIQAQRDANAVIGMTAEQAVAYNRKLVEEAALRKEVDAALLANIPSRAAEAEALKRSAAAMRELFEAQQLGAMKKDLADFLDPNKAQTFGDALRDAFGGAGSALVKLSTTFQSFAKGQKDFAKQRANAAELYLNGQKDEAEYTRDITKLNKMQAHEQLKGYGDMAGAAAGFFGEQSKGYKVLTTVSQVFHAAELAMTLAELVPKGISAVLSQGQGDPYSAFARMAAMAAIVAGLGVAIGGGGGGGKPISQQRQETQGTGTVFGDSTAKSDSIKRALELMSDNSSIELTYTRGMLLSLRGIESSLSGLGNLLIRNSGLTGEMASGSQGSAANFLTSTAGTVLLTGMFAPLVMAADKLLGGTISKWTASISNAVFGGKKTVQDTGFTIDRTTLAAALAGNVSSFQYADIKKDGGMFHSDKTSTDKSSLGGEANAQFAKVISGLGTSVSEAAKLLGVGGDAFTQRLNTFVIDIGKISLKNLSGDEIQKQLEAVFSKLGDDMAKFGVAGLDQFQQVGEGYFETLTRIASNYANLDSILASSSTSFGQVGMSSIAARERLIALAGGIDELASAQASFNDNFLTEAERLAPVQKYVTDQLAAMGLQGIDTRDKFKDVVLGLANSGALATEAGAAQYTALLALADAFAKTHAATEDLTKSEQEIADERKDLLQQLDEITKSEAELLAIQRAGIADVNKALFDQVQAAKAVVSAKDALSAAYDRESSAAKTALDRSKAWVTTLNGLNANLALGNQSTLTPEQKYAEARAQFEKTLAAANAGDTTAQSGLSAAEQAFLTASQVVNASDAKYAADYARVIAANQEAAKWASQQVDLQQASYDALEAQVKSLITINDSVLTVAQAIANLQTAMGVTDSMGVKFTNAPAVTAMAVAAAPAIDFSRYQAGSNAGSDAMAAEIKALREEVKGLRADQAKQTGAMIQSNEQANAKAADKVVSGVEKSAQASAWSSTVKGEYA
ncbi:hypothetical protein ASF04_23940 [Duganella sp. Leaf61]|uniref:phage tail length tape measure family protein n=1 Tax=Duganella sp. Leaf61 TaxID=1736227 RepID=UPI0006F91223|nr:phage tail length tape measure family protein [Duganella sp. Leaf61]KQN77822.1 hypothetical protein ASF04_23940 [Duganella sp. Leaf61]